MADVTDTQLAVLRHSLGLDPSGKGRIYRNHFVVGPGCSEYDDCEALVALGFMTRHDGNPLSGGDPIFVVTLEGKAVARG